MKKINYDTYQKPSRFVRFEQGDNRVKIISDGIICYEHGTVMNGRYTPLGLCSETTTCEQCLHGNDPKVRYKWIAYLPLIKEVRVLAVGPQIGDELCVIGKKEEKAGNKSFEVIIHRTGVGKQSRYTVKKVEPTEVEEALKTFIKQSRDYLFFKYMNK